MRRFIFALPHHPQEDELAAGNDGLHRKVFHSSLVGASAFQPLGWVGSSQEDKLVAGV